MTDGWKAKARLAAREAALHFQKQIVDGILEDDEATVDLADYDEHYTTNLIAGMTPDRHTAVDLIWELSDWEPEDKSVWAKFKWADYLTAVATETYRLAVTCLFTELVGDLNEYVAFETIRQERDDTEDKAHRCPACDSSNTAFDDYPSRQCQVCGCRFTPPDIGDRDTVLRAKATALVQEYLGVSIVHEPEAA